MIDLLSTRAGIDSQTQACARLLAAIISTAIRDAAEVPGRDEKTCAFNLKSDPDRAIRWLFEPYTAFAAYARLIGLDEQAIRDALLSNRALSQAKALKSVFSEQDRRIIKVRYGYFLNGNRNPAKRKEAVEKYRKSNMIDEAEDEQSH